MTDIYIPIEIERIKAGDALDIIEEYQDAGIETYVFSIKDATAKNLQGLRTIAQYVFNDKVWYILVKDKEDD